MKLLIIGASGLVGWNLSRAAQAAGHVVRGTYASFPLPHLEKLQLRDREAAATLLGAFTPDVVACCSAWSWVDGCQRDPARAFLENAEYPAALARLCRKEGAQFIHFSTSYIFDGKDGPYAENAVPNPVSIYGESKLKGERLVQEATDGASLIIRTMGVYGEEPQEKNFVYQIARSLRAGKAVTVPSDQRGNASSAYDLALMTLALLDKRSSGTWNVAGPDPELYRRDFALKIAKEYSLDSSLLQFVPTSELAQPAPRPLAGGLIIQRAVAQTGHHPAPWRPVPLREKSSQSDI